MVGASLTAACAHFDKCKGVFVATVTPCAAGAELRCMNHATFEETGDGRRETVVGGRRSEVGNRKPETGNHFSLTPNS
jgi:uncharacterized membrane protein